MGQPNRMQVPFSGSINRLFFNVLPNCYRIVWRIFYRLTLFKVPHSSRHCFRLIVKIKLPAP